MIATIVASLLLNKVASNNEFNTNGKSNVARFAFYQAPKIHQHRHKLV